MKVKKAELRGGIEDRYLSMPFSTIHSSVIASPVQSIPLSPFAGYSSYEMRNTGLLLSTREPIKQFQRDSILDYEEDNTTEFGHPVLYSQLSNDLIKVSEEEYAVVYE